MSSNQSAGTRWNLKNGWGIKAKLKISNMMYIEIMEEISSNRKEFLGFNCENQITNNSRKARVLFHIWNQAKSSDKPGYLLIFHKHSKTTQKYILDLRICIKNFLYTLTEHSKSSLKTRQLNNPDSEQKMMMKTQRNFPVEKLPVLENPRQRSNFSLCDKILLLYLHRNHFYCRWSTFVVCFTLALQQWIQIYYIFVSWVGEGFE